MEKETIEVAKKVAKRIAIMAIIICVIKGIIFLGMFSEQAQRMNNLTYDVTLNDDGSMKVVETWDIYISQTNTIFKNFDKSSKFGKITDVTVKDLDTGKTLEQIYKEMYHVTTGCFYALDISGNKFEIAWGTGMEEKMGNKKYQITYTVTDVATQYNDCQELYWMFLSSSNAIPVKRATGTITLPKSVEVADNLKAWGHGPLNGNIQKVSNNKVQFDVDDLGSGRMLEIRIISSEKIMKTISYNKIKDYNYLNNAISQETKWADEANETAENWKSILKMLLVVYILIILIQICRMLKFYKLTKKKDDGINKIKLEYYRDIPRDGSSTPMEATYMYYFTKELSECGKYQSDVVAANILNLTLKKYISLRYDANKIYVKILKDGDGLKNDEKAIYQLLRNTNKKEEFEIGELNSYAKKHYSEYSHLINQMVNQSRENLYKEGLVDKGEKDLYSKSKSAEGMFNFLVGASEFVIVWILISMLPIFELTNIISPFKLLKIALILSPLVIISLIKNKVISKIQNKIAVLTQKGYEEKEQWKGLAKFLANYSMLDEATVPSLEIWEKYLVFATAFGIADRVIKQMKAKYPEVFVEEYWEDEKRNQYPVLNFSLYSGIHYNLTSSNLIDSISSNASKAYTTSLREISAHSSSSGGGGGGGFSGGGGGRRRRWPEWAVDKEKNYGEKKNSNRR